MYELTRYLPAWVMEAAWKFGDQIRLIMDPDDRHNFQFRIVGDDSWFRIHRSVRPVDQFVTLLQFMSLNRFMRRGPVLMLPDEVLCQALIDTEIRLSVGDYRQPHEIIGIALPPSILGPNYPALTFVWRANADAVFVWTQLRTDFSVLHFSIGGRSTLEEQLQSGASGEMTPQDWRILVQGSRIALNLGMLASSRPIETTPLPDKVLRQRRRPDDRLNQLAARHCQEIRFRDLVVQPRPVRDVMEGFGAPQAKQRRRGHWRNVAYGPGFRQHRWTWIDEYETHRDNPWPNGQGPTTILR